MNSIELDRAVELYLESYLKEKKTLNVAITGHRPSKLGNEWDGIGSVSDTIRFKLQQAINVFKRDFDPHLITGMALGVDMIFAELAIKNQLDFTAAIPCHDQDKKWSAAQQARYFSILRNYLCTPVCIYDGPYIKGCMQQRNEWMVDLCDVLIAVWDGSPGGTANCVAYAQKKGKEILRMHL